MFGKMLVCSDLTPASDALIRCIAELKSLGLEEVVLAHVIHVANTPGLEERLAQEARPALERQKRALEEQGVRVAVEMPSGVPDRMLDESAEKHEVDAIVVGSHGKGIIRAATLGSVSAKLLQRARRPLLLARIDLPNEGESELVCRKMFTRVLFPTDFSETAEKALAYLGKIALETRCLVTLMHVISEKDEEPAAARRREEEARYLLEAKKRRLEKLGAAEVIVDLVWGKPAKVIAGRANGGDISSIVMGCQGKGFLQEIFLGSTASEVARHALAPLLAIPADR